MGTCLGAEWITEARVGISGGRVDICACNKVYASSGSESDDSETSKSDSDVEIRDEDSPEMLPSSSVSSSRDGRAGGCWMRLRVRLRVWRLSGMLGVLRDSLSSAGTGSGDSFRNNQRELVEL